MDPQPDNPYNIKHDEEKRYKRIFIVLIAIGFVAAFIFIGLGFALDAIFTPEPDAPPKFVDTTADVAHGAAPASMSSLGWEATANTLTS